MNPLLAFIETNGEASGIGQLRVRHGPDHIAGPMPPTSYWLKGQAAVPEVRFTAGSRAQPRVNQTGVSTARGREFESFERESGRKRRGCGRGDGCGVPNGEPGRLASSAQRRVFGGVTAIAGGGDFTPCR